MRRRLQVLLVAVAIALAALPGSAVAENAADVGDDPVYLSLGTSLAAGTKAKIDGTNKPFSNKAYTDKLYRRITNRITPDVEHVKLGCPGETTVTFINGGICGTTFPRRTYDTGNQLGDAVAWLGTGRVELVTIDIGANDSLQASDDLAACAVAPDPQACLIGVFTPIIDNVVVIMSALRAADADVPIIAMNYYNPSLANWLGFGVDGGVPSPELAVASDSVTALGNFLLGQAYAGFGVPVADVYTAYKSDNFKDKDGDGVPKNVEVVCKLTSMCPDAPAFPNIHPKPKGYARMAATFFKIVKDLGVFGGAPA